MIISAIPAAGQQPSAVVNASTSYVVTALLTSPRKITAQLSAPMPPGVTLTGLFAAPPGATSNGTVTLDATARDVVTNIGTTLNDTERITYTLSATVLAGVVASQSRTVTLTLTAFP